MRLVTDLLLFATATLAVVAPLRQRDARSVQFFDGNINITSVDAWGSNGGYSMSVLPNASRPKDKLPGTDLSLSRRFQFVMKFIHFDPATTAGCSYSNDTAQPSRIPDATLTFCNVATSPENNPLTEASFRMIRTLDNGAFLNMTYIWRVDDCPWFTQLTYEASRYMPPDWFRYRPDQQKEVYEGPAWFLTDTWLSR